ncbi:protein CURVATURE THYLAKOID 1B, chloroplastic-like isoform X1 [Telopea speciosissima]|uniref:protein CURVATURE THYLAKOID 1B, chloroplastic-like isoform X1 n=1 Tax=Telopea speciosissima TaxID=54955 RepID=UPI001CC520FB|nr:protein CURVATURE THYLAKOID 1B, chloroplastic-like isoform X1 [Telopea speciosissima]XP_043708129.1 protein CURVATURE THYLAKOID 1B, chloroplastic-like isoform X1 [Telopea speciosissima]
MASTSTTFSISSSSTLIDGKAPRQSAAVSLPTLPPPPMAVPSQSVRDTWTSTAYCRKISRNVVAMATGETSAEVTAAELPDEIVKSIQEAWEKLEDKYAVTSLALAGAVGLWVSTGMISAIDRLPLVPGVLELVGIGYTGWFAYQNLVFKPDREALINKIKDTYKDIIGSS